MQIEKESLKEDGKRWNDRDRRSGRERKGQKEREKGEGEIR